MNKMNLFPALTAPFPLMFLSSLFIAFEAKGIATFISTFLPKLSNQRPKDPLD